MRNLTSVQSSTFVVAQIAASIVAADVSTTWAFAFEDLVNVSGLNWEVPFMGGISKPVNYDITLSTSLGWIKENISKLPKAQVKLKINVNSDVFYPHVGRVREIKRDGKDLNLVTFSIYDQLLDDNPYFPDALTDSYSTLPSEVVDKNLGHPTYYGKHHRPFYFTPVDSGIGSIPLLAPRNVSNANLVNSLFFCSEMDLGYDHTKKHNLLGYGGGTWWGSGVGSMHAPFEVRDAGAGDVRLWEYTDSRKEEASLTVTPQPLVGAMDNGQSTSTVDMGILGAGAYAFKLSPTIGKLPKQRILKSTELRYCIQFSNATSIQSHGFHVAIDSGPGVVDTNIVTNASTQISGTTDISGGNAQHLFTNNQRAAFSFRIAANISASTTVAASVGMAYQIDPSEYKNYSLFAPVVNSSDVAVSENPLYILSDVFSRSAVPFILAQNSYVQVQVQSYNFQSFFSERQAVSEIADEFGRVSGVYLWLGDSGMMNFRNYVESATATNCINTTITTSDMFSFNIKQNPLGTSAYDTAKASRVRVEYLYNYTTGKFDAIAKADQITTLLCNSARAIGIKDELAVQTRHILQADTASYYLGNLVRRVTQSEEFVEMDLPARYFGLELADLVKVHHPMITGSQGIYQVIAVKPEYLEGRVNIRAERLLSLNPT